MVTREVVLDREKPITLIEKVGLGPLPYRRATVGRAPRGARPSSVAWRGARPCSGVTRTDRRDRDPADGPAAGRRRVPAHDDPVRDRAAELDPGARARARQGQAHLPRRPSTTPPATTRRPRRSTPWAPICNIVQSLKLPDGNVKVLVEGLDRGRALEFRKEEQGFLQVVVKLIPRQVESRRRRRGA